MGPGLHQDTLTVGSCATSESIWGVRLASVLEPSKYHSNLRRLQKTTSRFLGSTVARVTRLIFPNTSSKGPCPVAMPRTPLPVNPRPDVEVRLQRPRAGETSFSSQGNSEEGSGLRSRYLQMLPSAEEQPEGMVSKQGPGTPKIPQTFPGGPQGRNCFPNNINTPFAFHSVLSQLASLPEATRCVAAPD